MNDLLKWTSLISSLSFVLALLTACGTAVPLANQSPSAVAGVAATPTVTSEIANATIPSVITTTGATSATTSDSGTSVSTATPSSNIAPSLPPILDLSRYSGHPGEILSLRAGGFHPGETVHLQFQGYPPVSLGDLLANDKGEVYAEALDLPSLAEGRYDLIAIGDSSGTQVSRMVSIVGFNPWVVLSNYALRSGDSFGFAGSEFVPGEQVQVFLDSAQEPLATVTADNRGNIALQSLIQVTPEHVGKHNLQFVASQSSARLPVAFEVLAFVPKVELTPYAGLPGSVVSFTGHGFAPGEIIHAYVEQFQGQSSTQQEVSSFRAEANGAFETAGQFLVSPDGVGKTLAVSVEGEQSKVKVTQHFGVLSISPWAGLSTYSGAPGSQIEFLGKSYAAGEPIEVRVGGGDQVRTVASGIASSSGDFQVGPFPIPDDATGTITFTIVGQNSRGQATVDFTVIEGVR